MCHVLIVEDEPLIALDLESLLADQGATSFSFAASEAEAVSEAFDRQPDLITSDVTLLEGTGPSAVRTIRAALGAIPVIFVSALAIEQIDDDATTRALLKPLNRAALITAFHELRAASFGQPPGNRHLQPPTRTA